MPVAADAIPFNNNTTNVGYGDTIVDFTSPGNGHLWAAQYYVYTTFPAQNMSQLGATVFATYVLCGATPYYYASYESVNQPWMIQQNVSSYHGSPLYKYDQACPGTTSYSVWHNDVVHYWQAYGGATGGATKTKTAVVLAPTYFDVPISHWAYTFIEPAYQTGIMDFRAILHGCSPSSFCPDQPVTRGEMAYFLERGIRGADENLPRGSGLVFSDVPQSYENQSGWFGYPYSNVVGFIEKLSADGITGGYAVYPYLSYCPNGTVSRDQMAVFLLRAEHGSSYVPPPVTYTSFSDVPGDYWAAPWIQQIYTEGITGGCSTYPLQYCPTRQVTREEMAVFLRRTFAP